MDKLYVSVGSLMMKPYIATVEEMKSDFYACDLDFSKLEVKEDGIYLDGCLEFVPFDIWVDSDDWE